jgi:hypothetical protein
VVFIVLAFLLAACNDSKPTSPEAKLAFSRVIPEPISAGHPLPPEIGRITKYAFPTTPNPGKPWASNFIGRPK